MTERSGGEIAYRRGASENSQRNGLGSTEQAWAGLAVLTVGDSRVIDGNAISFCALINGQLHSGIIGSLLMLEMRIAGAKRTRTGSQSVGENKTQCSNPFLFSAIH